LKEAIFRVLKLLFWSHLAWTHSVGYEIEQDEDSLNPLSKQKINTNEITLDVKHLSAELGEK